MVQNISEYKYSASCLCSFLDPKLFSDFSSFWFMSTSVNVHLYYNMLRDLKLFDMRYWMLGYRKEW